MIDAIKPTFCLYHRDCADGQTAAWVIACRWPDVIFHAASYGDSVPSDVHPSNIPPGSDILLVDFSYPADILRRLASTAAVTVLDHHKTSEADLRPLLSDGTVRGVFASDRSGARLAWEYAFPDRPSRPLVDFVEDRDLWRFHLKGTRQVHAWLTAREFNFENWSDAAWHLEDPRRLRAVLRTGETLLDAKERELETLLRAALGRTALIGGHLVPVANCPYWHASELGNRLCVGHPFSATYVDDRSIRRWSLRSKAEGLDVSAIAKSYGGGGHARAAGFETPQSFAGDQP